MNLKIAREVKIGLLMLLTLLLFIWGVNFLKGKNLFSRQTTFFVVYDQVNGLIETHPVSLNGLKIGQVERIYFHPDQSGRIIVQCVITNPILIPANSVALLSSSGLLGTKEIIIQMGNSQALIDRNDTLQGSIQAGLQEEISQQILPLKDKAETLMIQMENLLSSIDMVLNETSRQNISSSIERLNMSLGNLESTTSVIDSILINESAQLSSMIRNASSIAGNLESHNETISHILQNLDTISDSIASADINTMLKQAHMAIGSFQALMQKIDKGEGSLGLLVNDQQLYQRLEASSHELEMLLEDVRMHPGKYFNISVFGGK